MADSTAAGSVPVSMPSTVLPHWEEPQPPKTWEPVRLASVGVDEVFAIRMGLFVLRRPAA